MRPWELQVINKAKQKEIRFAWVCRNIHFNTIERVELTDVMLLTGSYPSWITSGNCEILAKILPTAAHYKNGDELWEGDIVSHPLCIKEPHEGDEPCEHFFGTIAYEADRGQWFAIGSPAQHSGYVMPLAEAYKFKYIGNKWQNPELLKENI